MPPKPRPKRLRDPGEQHVPSGNTYHKRQQAKQKTVTITDAQVEMYLQRQRDIGYVKTGATYLAATFLFFMFAAILNQ